MKTAVIHSFDEYCKYTEQYKNRAYFRGQANSAWSIVPALFRGNNASTLDDEIIQIRQEMAGSGLDALPALFKLQHYGTPTRICDLTISPLTALFFATNGEETIQYDGVVYVFRKDCGVNYSSLELGWISKVLSGNILPKDFTNQDATDIEAVLQKNLIIQYDFHFSYTNQRAMLQGGTGLLFGFSFDNGVISQNNKNGIEEYIKERVIIPSSVKQEILLSLRQIGYSETILYDSLENFSDDNEVELNEISSELGNRISFNKYVAKYSFSNLYFNRDVYLQKVGQLYNHLFSVYGINARIWINFYYDRNDEMHGNCLCRTVWDENAGYNFVWTKNYYQKRMIYMNEEASRSEVVERFSNVLNEMMPIYREIIQSDKGTYESLPDVLGSIEKYREDVNRITSKAMSIPFGDYECEKACSLALNFICSIDWLVRDMIFSRDSGDFINSKESTYYSFKIVYKTKCEELEKKMEMFFKFVEDCTKSTSV